VEFKLSNLQEGIAMKLASKKILSIFTAVVLMLALSLSAVASPQSGWYSFQSDNTNNGTIDNGTPPTATPIVKTVQLPSSGTIWSGVDASSVIGGDTVYTLYNGGSNGARVQATSMSAGTAAWNWAFEVPMTQNQMQLSTPYIDDNSANLYVLISHTDNTWTLFDVNIGIVPAPQPTPLAKGVGQPNTPITGYVATNTELRYLYFGAFNGAKSSSYYQYDLQTGTLAAFAAQDDFYWAGATIVSINNNPFVVFGGDKGVIYVNPVGANFTTSARIIQLVNTINNPGAIRSSIVSNGDYIYFTSQGTSSGILWQIAVSDLLVISTSSNGANLQTSGTTSSTPVISANGYIYVGTYAGFASGSVEAYTPGNATTAPNFVSTIYKGDPVQSSVIVQSDTVITNTDYIYFTTNTNSTTYVGTGYCYSFNGTPSPVSPLWSQAAGNAALQGFSSNNGYLVFGDDSDNLYILHN
jgi:hypothetical protein